VLSDKNLSDVISWTPSGKAFEIRKPKQFVADILPEHFKSAKYSSFTRKLHRWGFVRHYRGDEAGAFYHKDFIKGRLDLVEQMTCHKDEPPKTMSEAVQKWKATLPKSESSAPAGPSRSAAAGKPAAAAPPAARPPPMVNSVIAMPAPIRATHQHAHTQPLVAGPSIPVRINGGPVDLNAAIEAEVNRRLQERIDSAAMNRQALALLEKQRRQAELHSLLEQRVMALARHQSQLRASGLTLPQTIDLGDVYRKLEKPAQAPTIAFTAGDNTPMAVPPRNVQGARTA